MLELFNKILYILSIVLIIILLTVLLSDNGLLGVFFDFLKEYQSLIAGLLTLIAIPGTFVVSKRQDERQKKVEYLNNAFFEIQKLRSLMGEHNELMKKHLRGESINDHSFQSEEKYLRRNYIVTGYKVFNFLTVYGNKNLFDIFNTEWHKLTENSKNDELLNFGDVAVEIVKELHKNFGNEIELDKIKYYSFNHS